MNAQTSRAWLAAAFVAWIALCVPLLFVDVPPLADYPNHMARMDVLARLPADPVLADIYVTHWAVIPDLAIDSFMPFLLAVLPVHVAGRMLLALILLLDMVGVIACAACLHGRRTWWSIGAAFAAYNFTFLMGFLNFNLTLAAAMPLAALYMALRQRGRAAVAAGAALVSGGVLFMGHLMGLCFYLLLIGSAEAPGVWGAMRARAWPRLPWPAFAAIILPAGLYPMTGLHHAEGFLSWLSWPDNFEYAIAPVVNYVWWLDVGTAGLILGFVAAAALTRRLRIAPGAVLALTLLSALYWVTPNDIKDTSLVSVRLAVMAGFVLFMAIQPTLEPRLARLALTAAAALFLVRMSVVSAAWWDYRTDVANIRAAIAPVQPGERVTQIDIDRFQVPDYYRQAPTAWRLSTGLWTESHLMALALTERRAFWTNLFVNPDQQSVTLSPKWRAVASSGLATPDYDGLRERRRAGTPPAPNPFCTFDWIALQGAWAEPHPETLSPDWLELVTVNRTLAFYRVRRSGCEAAGVERH